MKLDLSMIERGAPASLAEAGAPIMQASAAEFGAAAFPLPAVADVSAAAGAAAARGSVAYSTIASLPLTARRPHILRCTTDRHV